MFRAGGVPSVDTKPFLWNNYEKYHSPGGGGGEVCAPTPHQPAWNYAHHPQEQTYINCSPVKL